MTAIPLLFNPGPVQVHDSVWAALNTSDLCHREQETLSRIGDVRDKLLAVCRGRETHAVVILTGSGTCALEAAIATAIPPTGLALVLDNGNYGERLRDVASARGIEHEWLEFGWGRQFDLPRIEAALQARTFTHILMVHHETSTGMLNPLADVAALAQLHSCELIVDAVSSVGAEEINVTALGVDWLVGSSNKCLEGLPGMSFVCARSEHLEGGSRNRPGLYLDLQAQYQAQAVRGEPAFTPAVQVLAAWQAALDIMLEEGVTARHKRYARGTSLIREHAKQLGLVPFAQEGKRSCCTSVFHLPKGVRYTDFHAAMLQRGYVVYHCPPRMGEVVRIATMGQLKPSQIKGMLEAMTASLHEGKDTTNG
ncbi:alanine--glyoxylate aminotransferase family protein [Micrococcus sp. FDAARGOS_333]|uniref:pyridoxal-phosphate-dependent aminotransferase family protein n=1 Tax=Micrococcus sp. FDAARGOS_333 TaxID=1930558 RepID=UPI000B4E7C02|nr:aminotransferase class V-fold PLP-dependent enzyme [Micrococcus sp. FDAARGOS_333]